MAVGSLRRLFGKHGVIIYKGKELILRGHAKLVDIQLVNKPQYTNQQNYPWQWISEINLSL